MCCVSSVSSDNGGSRQEAAGGREIFSWRLRSTQTESRPWTECLCSSVQQTFPVFDLLYHCTETGLFFSSIFDQNNKKLLYWFLHSKWAHIILVSYRQPWIPTHIILLLKRIVTPLLVMQSVNSLLCKPNDIYAFYRPLYNSLMLISRIIWRYSLFFSFVPLKNNNNKLIQLTNMVCVLKVNYIYFLCATGLHCRPKTHQWASVL